MQNLVLRSPRSGRLEGRADAAPLAMPPRPLRPLSTLALLRTVPSNSLAACDQALFEELVVERRFLWGRVFAVSDPDGIRHVLQDNAANYLRVSPVRRAFEFSARSGMVCLEGEDWWRHRRLVNPALDYRALRPNLPDLLRPSSTPLSSIPSARKARPMPSGWAASACPCMAAAIPA